jgi:diguanylate cyclase (GGDEF)-like protein
VKYTGRIIITIFFIISYFVMWYIGNEPLNYFYLVASILFCIFGWLFGKQYDKAKYFSEKDVLTDVFNRRFVERITPKLMALAQRNNKKIGVSVVDVDNFKAINDTYGHDIGDKVLQGIANALVKATRESDTVARWGGDEILIISPLMTIKCPQLLIQRVEKELKEISHAVDVYISVSIGTALYPDDGTSLNDLIKVADRNMYKFKFSKKES